MKTSYFLRLLYLTAIYFLAWACNTKSIKQNSFTNKIYGGKLIATVENMTFSKGAHQDLLLKKKEMFVLNPRTRYWEWIPYTRICHLNIVQTHRVKHNTVTLSCSPVMRNTLQANICLTISANFAFAWSVYRCFK